MKTFDKGSDIEESLRTLEIVNINIWIPTLAKSVSRNIDDNAYETRQNELIFKI